MTDEPPLVRELRRHWAGERASFHMPGHKGGAGAPPFAVALLGQAVFAADVSEMGGFDYLHAPDGAIVEAQNRASSLFGAAHTFFLVNGSTVGNQAALLATLADGDEVVMLRASHRSVFSGVVLAGAVPRYVPVAHDAAQDGWFLGDPAGLHGGRAGGGSRNGFERLRAVHVTRPNYYGMACDLGPYVALARAHDVPLIVDEAHGSHFGLHPSLPRSALSEGADIVIQSTHKTLGALTQSSMLHVREGAPVDVDALERALHMLQSSSPSVLLTLSLDAARAHIEADGAALLGAAVARADRLREAVRLLEGLRVLERSDVAGQPLLDPSKVVIDVHGRGLTGFAAARALREASGIWIELSDFRRIVCSVTVGDTDESLELLVRALTKLPSRVGRAPDVRTPPLPPLPPVVHTPRRAVQLGAAPVERPQWAGKVCAEYLIPYPPGIPLIVPGERIDEGTLGALDAFVSAGSRIVGPADPSLATLRVLT